MGRPPVGESQKTCHDHECSGIDTLVMVRFYLGISLLLCLPAFTGACLYAQEMPVKQIPQVVVESNKKFFSDDQTTRVISPDSRSAAQHENIGYVLAKNSNVVIRNYGGHGTLTSISMHGTGSNHTQVTWNGIPLNSPTTGQADLSLIPSGFMQTIDVVNGASGSLYGSGTFGGSVNLNSEPDWNNRLSVNYSLGAGSYGHYGHQVMMKTGRRNFQYHLSAMTTGAQNDFSYRDTYMYGSPVIKNRHNAYSDFGILQNIYLNAGKGNFIEAGIWYQKKSLEIPAIMGLLYEQQPDEVQKDSLLRSFVSYRKKGNRYALLLRSAFFSDHLNYRKYEADSILTIDSEISAGRFMNEADFRWFITSKLVAGGGIGYNHVSGRSNNYGSRIIENDFIIYGNLKYVLKDIILNAGLRKEFYEHLDPPPQFSAGARYKLTNGLVFRTSVSTKFRKPTLNEKYWRPGGNPDLRPEKGFGGELTTEWRMAETGSDNFWIDAMLTGYFRTVDNWIQWVARESLKPVEYKKVHARGIESWLEYGLRSGPVTFSGSLNYSFNRATIVSTFDNDPLYEGNQLIYTPKHSFRASNEVKYRGFSLGVACSYTGIRETVETANKNLRLPAYTLADIFCGFRYKISHVPFSTGFRVDNVFDKQYEIIRSYPVPGRIFHLVVNVGFEKQNQGE